MSDDVDQPDERRPHRRDEELLDDRVQDLSSTLAPSPTGCWCRSRSWRAAPARPRRPRPCSSSVRADESCAASSGERARRALEAVGGKRARHRPRRTRRARSRRRALHQQHDRRRHHASPTAAHQVRARGGVVEKAASSRGSEYLDLDRLDAAAVVAHQAAAAVEVEQAFAQRAGRRGRGRAARARARPRARTAARTRTSRRSGSQARRGRRAACR